MLKFKLSKEIHGEREIVEVWSVEEGKKSIFIAGIYPHEKYITVVSKYMGEIGTDSSLPPKTNITFNIPQGEI